MHDQVALDDDLAKLVVIAESAIAENVRLRDAEAIREHDCPYRRHAERVQDREVCQGEQSVAGDPIQIRGWRRRKVPNQKPEDGDVQHVDYNREPFAAAVPLLFPSRLCVLKRLFLPLLMPLEAQRQLHRVGGGRLNLLRLRLARTCDNLQRRYSLVSPLDRVCLQ